MKKKLVGISILFLILVALFFSIKNNAKAETAVQVTSVSSNSLQVGEILRFDYRVVSNASDFTIIALPDTQYYSESYPEIYLSQTQWVVDNKDDLNIVFVTHLGDIVQHGVLPGNHDMQVGGQADYYQEYFPASRYEDEIWWGGSFSQNKNNYQLFSAGGDDYLMIHMQYCPTLEAVTWANEIVKEHQERKIIVSTHAFLSSTDAMRLDHCQDRSDGAIAPSILWGKLIKNNTNIFLVLSGHSPGVARRIDYEGRAIHQVLSDYQNMEKGGNGYLRIINFQPASDLIQVTTYSPYLDDYLRDDDNQFDISFDMAGGKMPMGKITISNGVDKCTSTVEEGGCELLLTTGGENTLVATYSGDTNYKSSSSTEILVFVESE